MKKAKRKKGVAKVATPVVGLQKREETLINHAARGIVSRTVQTALEGAKKRFGAKNIGTLATVGQANYDDGFTTTLPSLNYCMTGNPRIGIPRGKIIEIYGEESSGKTTLLLQTIAEAQRRGLMCAFVDAEHALDLRYAIDLGVDVDNLIFAQPDYGEAAAAYIDYLVGIGVDLVGVDSVAALTPLAIIQGDYDKVQPGAHARLMGLALGKLSKKKAEKVAPMAKDELRKLSKEERKAYQEERKKIPLRTSIIFTNQVRNKFVKFGNPQTTSGGYPLRFYASARIEMRLGQTEKTSIKGATHTLTGKKDKERMGAIGNMKMVKNKLGPPYRSTTVPLYYGKGYDATLDLFNFATDIGVIQKVKGGWKVGRKQVSLDDIELQENQAGVWELIDKTDLKSLVGVTGAREELAIEIEDSEEE